MFTVVPIPMPMPGFGGIGGFPFPYPGRGGYPTGPSSTTTHKPILVPTPPSGLPVPATPPFLKFNFPAPIVPRSVVFPSSSEDQQSVVSNSLHKLDSNAHLRR